MKGEGWRTPGCSPSSPKCEMQGLLQLWSSWNRNKYNPPISTKFPCLWILHRSQNQKCVRNRNYSTSRIDGQLHPWSILIHRQVCEAFLHSQFIATVSYFLANNQPTSWFCAARGSSVVGARWVAGSIQSTMAACLTSIQDRFSPCQCQHFHLSLKLCRHWLPDPAHNYMANHRTFPNR